MLRISPTSAWHQRSCPKFHICFLNNWNNNTGQFFFLLGCRFVSCLFIANMLQLGSDISLMPQNMTKLALFSNFRHHRGNVGNVEVVSALSWSVRPSTGHVLFPTAGRQLPAGRPEPCRSIQRFVYLHTTFGAPLSQSRITHVPSTPET